MAVKIRLKRIGKKRAPHYRIVVMDARAKRDGRAIEEIGKYNPKTEPSFIHVESDRAQYWLGVGAQPTEAVEAIFKASGDWQKFKGLDAPPPLRVKEPKRDKQEIFNEALAEAHGTLKTEAVTKKAAAKKAEPKADKKAEAKADEAKTDEVKADEVKADDVKADEAPAAEAAADAPADDAKA
ncbi:30S ribosomal protein S16 [Kribbella sp. CA-294648]|uniref:30S ribosomal protein S16 n=1 Tax=Kribbella sp. CA-294648 TaxID=3239948 RepID=UPI003D8BF0CE